MPLCVNDGVTEGVIVRVGVPEPVTLAVVSCDSVIERVSVPVDAWLPDWVPVPCWLPDWLRVYVPVPVRVWVGEEESVSEGEGVRVPVVPCVGVVAWEGVPRCDGLGVGDGGRFE